MSDFLLWLHAHYICPHLKTIDRGDYDAHFDLVESDLSGCSQPSFDRCLEFTAVHAFLLGLRTGEGLSHTR